MPESVCLTKRVRARVHVYKGSTPPCGSGLTGLSLYCPYVREKMTNYLRESTASQMLTFPHLHNVLYITRKTARRRSRVDFPLFVKSLPRATSRIISIQFSFIFYSAKSQQVT